VRGRNALLQRQPAGGTIHCGGEPGRHRAVRVRHRWYDRCRKAKHTAPLEAAETQAADTPDIAQLLVDKDAAFTVHQCLHALEEPYKEVFSLRVFGELSFEDIGAIFGHNAAWARVTYYRAKTKLQAMLQTT